MSLDTLPTEVQQIIFSFTTWRDQQTISLVCRRWAAAVGPLLSTRSYLKIFRSVETPTTPLNLSYGNVYTEHHVTSSSPIQLIDKKLLIDSERRYTSLKVEWDDNICKPNMSALQEVLDVCQERFPVNKLYFKAPPSQVLVELFNYHRKLLERLTELHFEQCDTVYQQLSSNILELSLPNLKQLTWIERMHSRHSWVWTSTNGQKSDIEINKLFATLYVPELVRLKVRTRIRSDRNRTVYLGQEQTNQCCLFLPSLNLKFCPNLQHVEVLNLVYMDQALINHSATVLHNLKSLTLLTCNPRVIEKICEKCSNLEELNINETTGDYFTLQFFSILPDSLQKLSLTKVSIYFADGAAMFPALCFLRLIDISATGNMRKFVLDAPKLTTIDTTSISYNLLEISHKEQIRTMVLHWSRSYAIDSIPPPNVKELFLHLRNRSYDGDHEILQNYLEHYPNLSRLTIFGKQGSNRKEANEWSLRSFPNLEYLFADGVTFPLAEFHALTHLKSLVLSDCILKLKPYEEAVMLKELQRIQARMVVIVDETGADRTSTICFPIRVDVLQPIPVPAVRFSRGYLLKECYQIIPRK